MSASDESVGEMASSNKAYMTISRAMENHAMRHGLLMKKTPDGARRIRVSTNAESVLNPTSGGRSSADAIWISRSSGSVKHSFCGFEHGIDATEHGNDSERFVATMSLAQLRRMAEVCAFCKVLITGIYRFAWDWRPKLDKYKYCDIAHENRHMLNDDEFWNLLDAADRGHFDERFTNYTLSDSDVALYISINAEEARVRVNVQKYPPKGLRRTMPLVELEVFTAEGTFCPWRIIGSRPGVNANVLSESGIAKIQGWIQDCLAQHQYCRTASSETEMPSRLLEVKSQRQGELDVRLINVDPQRTYQYAALSHSWASSRPLKMIKANYESYQVRIPWDQMSQVLKDTFTLANALEIRYVWVDSLCIIQQDADDWEREASRMGLVYSNAFIVFAALGEDFALEKEPAEKVEIVGAEADTQQEMERFNILFRRRIDHDNIVNSANDGTGGDWFLRAWCFQERLFASRILHFGGTLEDITFECNEHLKCECGGVDDLSPMKRPQNERGTISSMWCHLKAQSMQELNKIGKRYQEILDANNEKDDNDDDDDSYDLDPTALRQLRDQLFVIYIALCEDFTPKHFTFPADTLPALSSLAAKLEPYLGDFHGGIWEHLIVLGLQWETFDVRHSRRIEGNCAPSFSWASRTGGVIWYFDPDRMLQELDDCEMADVVEVYSEPAEESLPFGKVKLSYIHLEGWLVYGHIMYEDRDEEGRLLLQLPGGEAYVQMDCEDDIEDMVQSNDNGAQSVVCFELMRDKPGPNSRDGSGRTQTFASALVVILTEPGKGRRVGFSIIESSVFDEESSHGELVIN